MDIQFAANQFNFQDGMYGEEVKAIGMQAYSDYVHSEESKPRLASAGERIFFKDERKFETLFKEVAKFCYYFISYNPFFRSLKDAYEAAEKFYQKFAVEEGLKLSDCIRLMRTKGVLLWFVETMKTKRIHVSVSLRGPHGRRVFDENELPMFEFFRCMLLHTAAVPELFLPERAASRATLTSMQKYLLDDSCPEVVQREFGWISDMEISETSYNYKML